MTLLAQCLQYVKGYLILNIRGSECENFLNLALEQNITLWDIEHYDDNNIYVKMLLKEYRALPSLARKSRCRIRIVDKRGIPFLRHRLRGRQMLLLGGLFFALIIYILSTFIWVIEVKPQNGPLQQVQPAQIVAAAKAEGLKLGARKKTLDVRTLEFALEKRLPQLAWVGISFRGTRAEISIVEKIPTSKEEKSDRPASIIAAKDGIIKDILVIDGEKRADVGDTVRAGEILISGLILPPLPEQESEDTQPNIQPRLVRARGIVRARVWYEKEQQIERQQIKELPTGQKQTAIMLHTSTHRYILKNLPQQPYKRYRIESKIINLPSWGKYTLPVKLNIVTYHEVKVLQQQLDYEQAVNIISNQALKELKAKLPAGINVCNQKVIILSKPEAEVVKVRVWVETEEDIGKEVFLNSIS